MRIVTLPYQRRQPFDPIIACPIEQEYTVYMMQQLFILR